MVTYGDGVASVDLAALLEFHRRSGKLATLTAVRAASRFGELSISDDIVQSFREKPQRESGWINGGFFVLEPEALDLIEGDDEALETGLLARLTKRGLLAAYRHEGFWQCMDTPRERIMLNELWRSGHAPWAGWRK
jgi:glucose-1-phosphate cytidylyltransferase